jgi:5-methylcytosine-specific restriction endonuclease McrA
MNEIKHRRGFDNNQYHIEKAKLPKPDGKHCIICGKELPPKRRKYCSIECWQNWYKGIDGRYNWQTTKWEAMQRDNQKCVKCGKDGEVVDHILPIALGGEEFDMKNLQTLCGDCNKDKTRNDIRAIAELRRKIKAETTNKIIMEEKIKIKNHWNEWNKEVKHGNT